MGRKRIGLRQVRALKSGEIVWDTTVKTAKALGLTIPQSLLLRADEVIE